MDEATTRRTALITVTLMSLATPFMVSGVNVALPRIGQEFGVSALLLSWLATAYSLAGAVFLLPAGKLADIHGRKRVFLVGTAVYAVASVLCASMRAVGPLIAARVVQGVGAAMLFATSTAILTSVFPAADRGRVLGYNVAAVYLGMSAGPFVGGLMVEAWGWRSVFWVNVPLSLLTLLFGLWKMKGEWAGSPDDRFDLAGSAIYGVAVVALMLGFSQLPALRGAGLIAAGLACGAAFFRWERRAAFPVLALGLLRGNRVFVLSSLAALTNYAATSSVTFLLSLYLQYAKGLTPRQAGTILIAQPIVQTILSPLAGRLSDRVGARNVASGGMAFTVTGLILLTFLRESTPIAYVVGCLLVLGFGFALFSSPNTSAIMGAVERRYYGMASSIVATMRLFGQMLSMGIAMILFALYMGQAQITPEYYGRFIASARTAFAISAVLCALGIVASLARNSGHPPAD
ncbi:MAG: MFS transporter [Chloroflexota bacterium]